MWHGIHPIRNQYTREIGTINTIEYWLAINVGLHVVAPNVAADATNRVIYSWEIAMCVRHCSDLPLVVVVAADV